MRFFVVLLGAFLISCSSPSPKISLDNVMANGGPKNFIIDDTKYYYGGRQYPYFFKFEEKDFNPSPKYVLDAELAKSLDSAADAKGVRLKKLAIYFGYASSEYREMGSALAAGMGAAIGGAAGARMIADASQQPGSAQHEYPDRQIVGCDFMARFKGRIIEFTISTPTCDGDTKICFKSDSLRSVPIDNSELQKKVQSITHACIDKAVAGIEAIKNLPPLADANQEKR